MSNAWSIPSFGNTLRGKLFECLQYTSLPMLLRYEDRNSMAHGIESRVPFLHPRLVEFAMGLPEHYLLSPRGVGKHVFREAMRGITPNAILDRKDKIGFATPEQAWLSTLQPWVESVMHGDTARDLPCFHHPELIAEWKDTLAGKQAFNPRIWRWLNLIRWVELMGVNC